jgi:NTP pyrophosphatase (non-canonical NTP hydrolase)
VARRVRLNIEEYSNWVEGKIITEGQERLVENTLGLVGEAGEVAEKVKKMIRDGRKVAPMDIIKELGDVVFYCTALANHVGYDLRTVVDINVVKLDDRQKRGVIKGNGDNR